MNPAVELTEKLLIEAGGWPVFNQARALQKRGGVLEAGWKPPLLQGSVREGERVFRAGLRIAGRMRIDNLCTCRTSREWGSVCAHSLAIGLAVLEGAQAAVQPSPAASEALSPGSQNTEVELPFRSDPATSNCLHIVLPANLPSSWEKGEIVLGLEISETLGKHRKLVNLAAAKENYTVISPDDHRVLRVLAKIAARHGTALAGVTMLSRAASARALEALRGHPRITLGRDVTLKISDELFQPILEASVAGAGRIKIEVKWPPRSQPLLAADLSAPLWLYQTGQKGAAGELIQLTPGLPAGYHTLYQKPTILSEAEAAAFITVEWTQLARFFDLRDIRSTRGPSLTSGFALESRPAGLQPISFQLNLEGSLNELTAELHAVYQLPDRAGIRQQASSCKEIAREILLPLGNSRQPVTGLPKGFLRDAVAEQIALGRLKAGGFSVPDSLGRCVLRSEKSVLRFFASSLPSLRQDWRVRVGARFEHVTRNIETVSPRVQIRGSGQDWFELDITLATNPRDGGAVQTFSAAEIQRLLQMGSNSLRTKNGRLAVLPAEELDDLSAVLHDIEPDQRRPGFYRIKKIHAGYVDAALGRFGPNAALDGWQEWKQHERTLAQPVAIPLSPSLHETLRGYQKEGVYWLNFLAGNNLGGILADEMGLGKTLQTLAFLSIVHSGEDTRGSSVKPPSLVVCPSSLLENWRREAARFTPQLRTLVLQGEDRAARFAQIASFDLVITSYALLRRDAERYRTWNFLSVILDEGHHIKNPASLSARAVCALQARHRFVLTGTPVENSVLDLWSIMHFVLPGYLGSHQDFRERYEKPIAQGRVTGGGDNGFGRVARQAQERLTRRLRPFLLRRRKRDVAAELPEKIEQVVYCELSFSQAQVYRELLEQSRRRFDEASRQKNSARGRMLALTALLRLRQVCCDLRLLGVKSEAPLVARETGVTKSSSANQDTSKDQSSAALENAVPPPDWGEISEAAPSETSGKLTLLDELLEQVREGEHRVLIFSQFVSMLKLLAAHFSETKLPFVYLDGATKDRAAVVDEFQNNPQITAFLISIKAGGTGLNLTAADTVIHFDPWWNPAVEAQATDRAHRIGQSRVVTAYKLITRGTVEEKILHLQRQKRDLNAALVDLEGEEPLITGLSLAEIESLLD